MIPTTQTDEILDFVADVFDTIDKAKSDDGTVSKWEMVAMSALIPAFLKAIAGLGELKDEWRAMDQPKLDAMRDRFLTRRNWQPTDDARDRFAVIYEVVTANILGAIKWQNTKNPAKAVIVS